MRIIKPNECEGLHINLRRDYDTMHLNAYVKLTIDKNSDLYHYIENNEHALYVIDTNDYQIDCRIIRYRHIDYMDSIEVGMESSIVTEKVLSKGGEEEVVNTDSESNDKWKLDRAQECIDAIHHIAYRNEMCGTEIVKLIEEFRSAE